MLPAAELGPSRKRAGVCFRGDDNHSPAKWRQLLALFERYDCAVSASLNLLSKADDADYMAFVRELQERGHEYMDHSPTHRVFSMQCQSASAASAYAGQPGVDHVRGNVVYFRYVPPASVEGRPTGTADIKGSTFASSAAEVLEHWSWEPLVMLEGDAQVYLFDGERNAPCPSRLQTLWGEDTVDLPSRKGVRFYRLSKGQVSVVPDALRHQARLTREICSRHGVRAPVTWIQPGGAEPVLHRRLVKQVLGDEFGYTAAATYPDASLKCFNEHDPDGDKRFGMQWGNFQEDRFSVAENKKCIADGVARHYVMFGHSHLNGRKEIGGWEGYLRNTEELLKWCREKRIPVRTYCQWADTLYGRPADPSVNVFPDIAADHDDDGQPDGIVLGNGVTVLAQDDASGPAELSVPPNSRALIVRELAGIEKGANVFAVELSGPAGAKLDARFTSRDAKIATEWLAFEQTADGWQSVQGEITVPEAVSRVTIDLWRRDRAEPLLLIREISLTGRAD